MNNTNKSPNQMTKLLNKIERRLGLQVINLPPKINKDTWHTIIEEDTIPEFSRLFPNKIISIIDNKCMKDDYYFIDKDVPEGCTIIGCGDIVLRSLLCSIYTIRGNGLYLDTGELLTETNLTLLGCKNSGYIPKLNNDMKSADTWDNAISSRE